MKKRHIKVQVTPIKKMVAVSSVTLHCRASRTARVNQISQQVIKKVTNHAVITITEVSKVLKRDHKTKAALFLPVNDVASFCIKSRFSSIFSEISFFSI